VHEHSEINRHGNPEGNRITRAAVAADGKAILLAKVAGRRAGTRGCTLLGLREEARASPAKVSSPARIADLSLARQKYSLDLN